jgi:very-short-patch-repair endonuclease
MSLNKNKELREIAKRSCRELRKNSTNAEKMFWNKVRNHKFLGKKFYRQYPIFFDLLGKESFYIADFYCYEEKIVVELDGKIHDYQKENDKLRTEVINNKGIEVIRFSNYEVENDIDGVLYLLEKALTHPQTPSLKREGAFKSPSLAKRGI